MTTEEITRTLADFAATAYQVEAAGITADTAFADLGRESMKTIAFTSMIENELDVEVPIREVMGMQTFGELVARVEEEL